MCTNVSVTIDLIMFESTNPTVSERQNIVMHTYIAHVCKCRWRRRSYCVNLLIQAQLSVNQYKTPCTKLEVFHQ